MKSKYLKILISLVLIVSLCLAFTVAQSNAVSVPIVIGGAGLAVGGMAWAIASAMGVEFSLQNYTSETIETFINPYYYVQTALQSSDFTFVKGISAGFDALRLSLAAFNAIKAGSKNLIEENNIQDNTVGTIERDGLIAGMPATYINGVLSTGPITFGNGGYGDFINGNIRANIEPSGTQYHVQMYYPVGNTLRYFQATNNTGIFTYTYTQYGNSTTALQNNLHQLANAVVVENGDLPYDSQEVDTSFGDLALDNITVIIPQQDSLTALSPLDDILAAINDLALDGNPDVSVIPDYEPGPVPPPIPTDALGDIPFNQFLDIYGGSVFEEIDNQTQVIDTLGQSVGQMIEDQTDVIDTYGQSVVEGIENQTDVIDTVGQSVVEAVENQIDVIDTVGQDVVEAVEAVDTNIQAGNGILSGIRSLIGSAVNTLEDIGEMVGELVEDIVLGTETLISGILNQIPSLFNVILSPIKTAASIWHYVVEWIQSITGPFQFIWSMANGTSYFIVLPVYASLAAAVVLAFYKRFGK